MAAVILVYLGVISSQQHEGEELQAQQKNQVNLKMIGQMTTISIAIQ